MLWVVGCKTAGNSGVELRTNCQLAISPDRTAIAYLGQTAIEMVKGDRTTSMPFAEHKCLVQGETTDLIALSAAGKFAVVLGEEAQGFNLHESVPFKETVCCLIDFDKRTVSDLSVVAPGARVCRQVRHQVVRMSTDSQLMFAWSGSWGELSVVDLAGSRGTSLKLDAGRGCDLVEVDRKVTLACPSFSQLPGGKYEYFVMVHTIDVGQWPPRVDRSRSIAVVAKLNGVALSRDGYSLAYWGYDFGQLGDYHDLHGVLSLASAERRFERRERRYGHVTAMEFAPDGLAVLIGEELMDGKKAGEKIGSNKRGRISRCDLAGKCLGSRPLKSDPRRIRWMADGFLCDLGCRAIRMKTF